jgi:hypothetical protein
VIDLDGTIYFSDSRTFLALKPLVNPSPLAKSSWPMWRANPLHNGRAQKIN